MGERSLTKLLLDIAGNLEAIIRSEVRLATLELRDEAIKAKGAAIFLGVGILFAALAMLFLLWAAVYALAIAIPLWAAALAIAFVVGLAAGLTLKIGLDRLRTVKPPNEPSKPSGRMHNGSRRPYIRRASKT